MLTSALNTEVKTSVKLVGANGQISLGKSYAGRQVLVEEHAPGVWYVRTALVIPENENWLHTPKAAASLQRALDWASQNPAQESTLQGLMAEVDHDKPARQAAHQTRPQQSRVSKKSTRP